MRKNIAGITLITLQSGAVHVEILTIGDGDCVKKSLCLVWQLGGAEVRIEFCLGGFELDDGRCVVVAFLAADVALGEVEVIQ